MKIAVAADHAGYPMKASVLEWLADEGIEAIDLGAHTFDGDDDYPDHARRLGEAVQRGEAERGILICGSGVGASVAANKMRGIRAGLCHDAYSAHQGVEHDAVNVLCFGARVIGPALAEEIVRNFCRATFSEAPRHRRRLDKVNALEGTDSRVTE